MNGKGWLALIVLSLALLISALLIHPIRAHDHNRPELNEWLPTLHSKGGAWCCKGDDTDTIEDWDTKAPGGKYRVKFRGQWFNVPDDSVVEESNKSGGALLWMNKGASGYSVRCFMPGPLT